MFQEWFAGGGQLSWPLVGLALSLAAFGAVIARLWRGRRDGDEFARLARLPLEDDAPRPPAGGERRPS